MGRAHGDRRERILASAGALFARQGVAATTVREIADEVGILSSSLYHYFASKEAIVDALVSSYLDDLRARYEAVLAHEAEPPAQLHQLVVASLEIVALHPHATRIYQNDVNYLAQFERFAALRAAGKEVQRSWLAVIDAGIARGDFRPDLDPTIVYRLMRDAVWLTARWYVPSRAYPIARLANDCTALFLHGLR